MEISGCKYNTIVVAFLLQAITLLPIRCLSQTVLMPVVGHGDTTMAYAVLYDDGGASEPHSSSCNASYTFHTVNPQGHYRITVTSYLTHMQGNASLRIYNGQDEAGTLVCLFPSGGGGEYFSSGNTVTVTFMADDDNPTQGFEVILCEYDNAVPVQITSGYIDSVTAYIGWDELDTSVVWIVDYALVDSASFDISDIFGDTANYSTIYADTSYLIFHDVVSGTRIVFRIYSEDSSNCIRYTEYVIPPYSPPAECPCVVPTGLEVISLTDSVSIVWNADTSVSSWHIVVYGAGIDTVVPGSVDSLTVPYDFSCMPDYFVINGNCTTFCAFASDYLPTGGCHLSVGNLLRQDVTGHSISVSWTAVDDTSARYLLYIRRQDQSVSNNVLVDTIPYNIDTYTVEGLEPHTYYVLTMAIICGDGSLGCYTTAATFFTTIDDCINFVDLYNNPLVHLTWGTYQNPLQNGVGASGRHTVIIDTSLYDSNTGGLLRCIPPDEGVSLRLGDQDVGAKAETIAFDYDVDSLEYDMLVIKFAVVLQNPNHNSSNQPKFSLEILDNNGNLIDTTCCYADFYADSNLGWNSVPGSNVIWKDWTTIGIDIAPYHGQRITIRLTTRDCADGGHFGYSYFTIHCDSKRIALVNLCESPDSVRLYAPVGFEYQWTRGDDPSVFSVNNEIIVPADSTEYVCYASFIGKPECGFTVRSFAVLPHPKAAMHYSIDTCNRKILLFNDSFVDIDSVWLPYVRQTVDSIFWVVNHDTIVGDITEYDIVGNSDYYLTVCCKLSDSKCESCFSDTVIVDFFRKAYINGDTTVCLGDSLSVCVAFDGVASEDSSWLNEFSWLWNDGDTSLCRTIMTTEDTSYVVTVDYLSCRDTLTHAIVVKEIYTDTIVAEMCPGLYDTLGFSQSQSGVYTNRLFSLNGCDSTTTLFLTVHPSYSDTLWVATCDESYLDEEFSADTTGVYTNAYVSVWGCDSLKNLVFDRREVFNDTITAEILYGYKYVLYGFDASETGFYQNVYNDINGCDSIYNLDLHVAFLRFPNAVTPNGDGYNDIFAIVGLLDAEIFYNSTLWVYDRWGRRVYHKENIQTVNDFWDPNETNSPDGTYFFRFFTLTPFEKIEHKGAVEVIRNQ